MTAQTVARVVKAWNGSVRGVAQVDAGDAWLLRWRWFDMHGRPARSRRLNGRKHTRYLAREVMGLPTGDPRRVRHLNGDPFDCRRANLTIESLLRTPWERAIPVA